MHVVGERERDRQRERERERERERDSYQLSYWALMATECRIGGIS